MTDGFAFEPATVTVTSGETVTWRNADAVEHTVTAYADELPAAAAYFASGGFDSEAAAREDMSNGLLAPGEEYEHTFSQPGSYAYFCIPHEMAGMTGTVRVTAD